MPYTDFSLETVLSQFNLKLETEPLFTPKERFPVNATPWLEQTLTQSMELSLASEKARSEFIVAPILMTVRTLSVDTVSIYSGQRFDVIPAEGLSGECDFILAVTKPVPIIQAPVISVVEAKRGALELGWGQCTAQMVAAVRFNEKAKQNRRAVYGCVTTGYDWQFIRLQDDTLTYDTPIFPINQKELILATFLAMLK